MSARHLTARMAPARGIPFVQRARAWTGAIRALPLIVLSGCYEPTLWLGSTAMDAAMDFAPPALDAAASAPLDALTPAPPRDQGHVDVADAGAALGSPRDATTAPPPAADPPPGRPGMMAAPDAGAIEPEADGGEPEPPAPTGLPAARGRCPKLARSGTYTFGDPASRTLSVQVYVAPDARSKPGPGGPLILYWHAFASSADEVMNGLGQAAIDAVIEQGGVVASFSSKPCAACGLPDDTTWYREDDIVSDRVVACALEQAKIDPRRIHSVGFSAGGFHSLYLAVVRAQFIASAVSYSGGANPIEQALPTPANPVAALLAWERRGPLETVGLDYNALNTRWYEMYHPLGWFLLMCRHEEAHEIKPEMAAQAYRFLLDHPFGVQLEPYAAGIPPEYPTYCSTTPPAR
jgi:hypothetical protein